MENLDIKYKVIHRIIEEMASYFQMPLPSSPNNSKLKALFLKAQNKLKQPHQLISADSFRGRFYEKFDYHFRDTERLHKDVAFIWKALEDNLADMYSPLELETLIKSRTGKEWDYYLQSYQDSINDNLTGGVSASKKLHVNASISLINDAFWETKKTKKRKAVVKDFIEKGRSDSAPYIVRNGFLPRVDIEKNFYYTDHNEDHGYASLYDLIFSEDTFRQVLTVTSEDRGEGKTLFIWFFIREYFQEATFFWISDLQVSDNEFPTTITNSGRIIVVIDGKVPSLENCPDALGKFYISITAKYPKVPITLLVIDSEQSLIRWDPLEEIRYLDYTLTRVTNFSLTESDNAIILYSLIKEYNIQLEPHGAETHIFLAQKLPLVYRVGALIRNDLNAAHEWALWQNDKTVNENSLQSLYFLVAFLDYLNIKFPLDYISREFLAGVEHKSISQFLRTHSQFQDILQVGVSQNGEYPTQFITLANKQISGHYMALNARAQIDSALYIGELIESINNGEGNSAHSYVFRKIYDLPLLLENPMIAQRISKLSPKRLFEALLKSPFVSIENKEKVKGEMAFYLQKTGKYDKAKDVLDKIDDQEGEFVKYLGARIKYQLGEVETCLAMLSELPLSPRIAALRYDCYSHKEFLKLGIEYYLSNIRNEKVEVYEFASLIKCLREYAKIDFEATDDYFSTLYSLYNNKQSSSFLANIIYERAHMYFIWVQDQKRNEKEWGKSRFEILKDYKLDFAVSLLEEGRKMDHSNDKFTLMESEILSYKNDLDNALDVFFSIRSRSPNNVTLNFVMSRLYYKIAGRNGYDETNLKNVAAGLERNRQLFAAHNTNPYPQLQTISLLSKVYWRKGNLAKAIELLKEFINTHNLNTNDPKLKNFISLLNFLEKEGQKPGSPSTFK